MENEKLVREAIGRVAYVGDLYDARSDTFSGLSILKMAPPPSAIKITDNHFSDTQFIHSDTFSDKFEKLDIKAELKVSVLAGLFTLEGHGKYLKDEKKSARAVRSSLLYNIKTKVEQLNLFCEELKDCFSMDALNVDNATHVVVEVCWGANSMVTMEYANNENRDIKQIQGSLAAHFKSMALSISGKAEVEYASGEDTKEKNFSLRIFADVLPSDEDLPQTIEDALALMKKMPRFVKTANDGKGKPLQYTLVPLSTLEKYLNVNQMADRLVKQLDEQAIVRFVQIFDDISIVKQQLNDLYSDMINHKFCVCNEDIKKVGQTRTELNAAEATLRSNLAKTLVGVRSGKKGAEHLEALLSEFENGDYSLGKVTDIVNSYLNVAEKIIFADCLAKEGISYIGLGASLESEQMKNEAGDIYVLYFGATLKRSAQQSWSDNRHHFLSLVRSAKNNSATEQTSTDPKLKTTFIAVDLDIRPEVAVSEGVENRIHICHYKNGKYISYDVLADYLKIEALCLARSRAQVEFVTTKTNKRVPIELRCPGTLTGSCEIEDYFWVCYKCHNMIEYGFDGYFYCLCGRALSNTFEFKCKSKKHGLDFILFPESALNKLLEDMRPFKEMNILILGETGVGKSTWINGMVNYMTYSTLDEAEQNEPLSLIPASFTILNEDFEEVEITTGKDANENHTAGQSATQGPKSYVFTWGDTKVRLIDTPGIGDTRGIDQDKKNFDAILRYLSNLDELHGICILLKPNNARLTVMFNFCIKELLTHLHRNAAQNIIFCFTNARSTFYSPGDTFPALKKLLSQNKDVGIQLSKHTIYCMDNESFRFLCCIHNGIKFSEDNRKNFSASWDKSVAENDRMFEHIATLKPHAITDTISLNEARKVIVSLTIPMAHFTKNIEDNIAVVSDWKNDIQTSKIKEADLAQKLHMPVIAIENVSLGYPRTVCTHKDCVEYYKVNGTTQTKFTTYCHEHCYLSYSDKHPNPDLKNCAAITNNYCSVCSHSWDLHLHTMDEQISVDKTVIDPDIEMKIKTKQNQRQAILQSIEKAENTIKELKDEQVFIRNASVKFGCFLKTNAITPYNDALADYLEILIRQEQDKVSAGEDRKTLDGLRVTQAAYKEEVLTLDESMKMGQSIEVLGPNEIKQLVKDLYNLPLKGAELKQYMLVATNSHMTMIKYNEVHYRPKYQSPSKSSSKSKKGFFSRVGDYLTGN